MFAVQLTCPGTKENTAFIKRSLDLNRGGLKFLWNSGTCPILVGTLDSSNHAIDDVRLNPGDQLPYYQPPAGGVVIYALCLPDCIGMAILNYEDPDLVG